MRHEARDGMVWRPSEVQVPSVFAFLPRRTMSSKERGSILGSVVGILICGVTGGFAAWRLVDALGIGGVPGALAAAAIGMVVATALWTGGTSLLRALGWVR